MQATFDKYNETFCRTAKKRKKAAGFSLIELIIVLVVIAILSAISIPYIYNYKRLYKSEDQALKVMDLMREASQLALTRRRTMRLEIDRNATQILIIDENSPGNGDDTQIKGIPLEPINEVRMDVIPTGVAKPNPPDYADAVFALDTIGHQNNGAAVPRSTVWAVRFNRNGTAVDSANTPISANLYFFPPLTPGSTTPRSTREVRAITIFGGTGAVRYWKHNGATFVPFN